MPGISMDGCGNIALMYDQSGATANPSIKYTGRNACDPLGTMPLPEQTIINGASNLAVSDGVIIILQFRIILLPVYLIMVHSGVHHNTEIN